MARSGFQEDIYADVLVVGAGVSGLSAAVSAARSGAAAVIAAKAPPGQAHSIMAEGGLNAAVPQRGASDVAAHIHDTLLAGCGLCNVAFVQALCEEAPAAVSFLVSIGARLNDQATSGRRKRGVGGGHSSRRIVWTGDFIGSSVVRALLREALMLEIPILSPFFLAGLSRHGDGRVGGGIFVDLGSESVVSIRARSLVLAAGGFSSLYEPHTGGGASTGEALVAALDAGAELADLEFIQFHPTCLVAQGSGAGRLISEAARTAGALLCDARGDRILLGGAPIELSTRDVVSQAIERAWRSGTQVFIDLRPIARSRKLREISGVSRMLWSYGYDAATDLVPVRPAAHYTMGGIRTDELGGSAVPGLLIAGEVGTGVHGANRLGGNSLSEALVAGLRAGARAARTELEHSGSLEPTGLLATEIWRHGLQRAVTEARSVSRLTLGRFMHDHAGIYRAADSLRAGLNAIESRSVSSQRETTTLRQALEGTASTRLATLVIGSGLSRNESRGAHQRLDFPNELPDATHTVVRTDRDHDVIFCEPAGPATRADTP